MTRNDKGLLEGVGLTRGDWDDKGVLGMIGMTRDD